MQHSVPWNLYLVSCVWCEKKGCGVLGTEKNIYRSPKQFVKKGILLLSRSAECKLLHILSTITFFESIF